MFEIYYNRLMTMTKAEIVREGMTWGVWANTESNYKTMMKYKKVVLARALADRLAWK